MTDNDWIKQLQSMMDGYQEPVPDGLWQDIEARIQPRRVRPVWRRYAAVAAVALAVIGTGGLLWLGNDEDSGEKPIISLTTPENNSPESEILAQNDEIAFPDADAPVASPLVTHTAPLTPAKAPANASAPNEHLAKAQSPSETAPTQETNENEPVKQHEEKAEQPPQKPSIGHINTAPNPNATQHIILPSVHKRQPVSVDLYASNAIQPERSSREAMGYHLFTQLSEVPDFQLYDSISIAEFRHSSDKHHAPYSFGMSVRLPLNDRLALTSGLVYTRLKSDLLGRKQQTLRYLGVPLGAAYSLWGYKRFSVYAIGGVQADFNIKATTKEPNRASDYSIKKDRVQFSALAGPGLQFDLSQDFGIYVEPTARYYFNNGSGVLNYFKDKPWNINFNAGLRLTIQGQPHQK